jgi:glycosyltransferase involved in cell wall biosynthesis
MTQVHEHYPEAKLLVYGDGPLRDKLQNQAESYPEETIQLRGRVPPDELYDAMATATATVFPSEWDEPFGRISVESMALGTPVVGSRVGGIAEIIDDGETGLLFQPGNAAKLADQLVSIQNNRATWERLSTASIKQSKRFSIDRIVENHLHLYQDLITR